MFHQTEKGVKSLPEHPEISFNALYKSQYEKMIKLAYRMLGSMESAQDIVQEAFILALLRWDEVSVHPLPEGWLALTVRNLVQNERRRYANHEELPLDSFAEQPDTRQEHPLSHLLPEKLSEEDRRILTWRFEQQMDYRQMADRLGISESACRSRVSRAVKRCGNLLTKKYF